MRSYLLTENIYDEDVFKSKCRSKAQISLILYIDIYNIILYIYIKAQIWKFPNFIVQLQMGLMIPLAQGLHCISQWGTLGGRFVIIHAKAYGRDYQLVINYCV